MLLSLSDESTSGESGPPAPRTTPARFTPSSALRRAIKVGRSTAELAGMPPDRRTIVRSKLGRSKSLRWSDPFDLDSVKAAARSTGGTLNDLVLSALCAALRKHMATAGSIPRDVRAVLPVNLRPLDTATVELGNRFGLVFLRLPVGTRTHTARQTAIRRRTHALKNSATAPVTLSILRLAGAAPTIIVQALVSTFSAKGSLVVTNVPGPRDPLHFGGCRLTGIVAWPPQSGSIGLGVSVISYAGQLVIGVMNDSRSLIDPELLLYDVRDELTALGAW